jgi:hypothetical protein
MLNPKHDACAQQMIGRSVHVNLTSSSGAGLYPSSFARKHAIASVCATTTLPSSLTRMGGAKAGKPVFVLRKPDTSLLRV